LVALIVHQFQLTLKRECHSKIAIWLKECSPKASQSVSRVSVPDLPFTELHAKLDIGTLLNFGTHHRQNETHKLKKHSYKNDVCSQSGATWQADAIGLQ
jgi:hypothetical protein